MPSPPHGRPRGHLPAEHHAGPKLLDVVLLGTNSSWLTLSGFERVDLGGRWADYIQTWLVEPLPPR